MKLNYSWFYGRDLRQLTDEEVNTAFCSLVLSRPLPKSKLARAGYMLLREEWIRRVNETQETSTRFLALNLNRKAR